ncbi:MAG TPA: transglutaminase-like domain-containing protein [Vicinamibacteria bacterium]|nr:transglutaminase-like domain-containing protein [Vicinamibacteria bacterium]
MTESNSRRQFRDILARPDAAVDLAEASLLIACEEYPGLDVRAYLARLDDMGSALRERLADEPRPERAVMALNRYLFQEEGFSGNATEYYDPRNSYLNEVLDRRTGIPISLSTVYIEVARRAGLRVEGVGLPGHFIVRVWAGTHAILIDPFHAGTLLSEDDCQQRLDRIFAGRLKMEASMLAPCGRKDILERTLRNLKTIYFKEGDHPRALGAVELLLTVNPGSAEDVRDRGVLYAALDCYGLAVRDLEAFLTLVPRAPEASEVRDQLADLRRRAARLN